MENISNDTRHVIRMIISVAYRLYHTTGAKMMACDADELSGEERSDIESIANEWF